MITSPWEAILAFYFAKAASFAAMASLADELAFSRYARSLHPTLDGDTLVLSRPATFAGGGDALRISYDPGEQRFTLMHLRHPDDPRPWTRDCEASEAWQVLERLFHRRLQWFHEG